MQLGTLVAISVAAVEAVAIGTLLTIFLKLRGWKAEHDNKVAEAAVWRASVENRMDAFDAALLRGGRRMDSHESKDDRLQGSVDALKEGQAALNAKMDTVISILRAPVRETPA